MFGTYANHGYGGGRLVAHYHVLGVTLCKEVLEFVFLVIHDVCLFLREVDEIRFFGGNVITFDECEREMIEVWVAFVLLCSRQFGDNAVIAEDTLVAEDGFIKDYRLPFVRAVGSVMTLQGDDVVADRVVGMVELFPHIVGQIIIEIIGWYVKLTIVHPV